MGNPVAPSNGAQQLLQYFMSMGLPPERAAYLSQQMLGFPNRPTLAQVSAPVPPAPAPSWALPGGASPQPSAPPGQVPGGPGPGAPSIEDRVAQLLVAKYGQHPDIAKANAGYFMSRARPGRTGGPDPIAMRYIEQAMAPPPKQVTPAAGVYYDGKGSTMSDGIMGADSDMSAVGSYENAADERAATAYGLSPAGRAESKRQMDADNARLKARGK